MTRPEEHGRALIVSERVYKALLAAYPKGFRRKYGSQMAQAFRDLCREEFGRGGMAGLVGLWLRTVLDLARTALVERSSGRANDKEVIVKDYKLAGIGFILVLAPLYFVSASLLKYGLGTGSCSILWRPFCPSRKGARSSTWSRRSCSSVGWLLRWR